MTLRLPVVTGDDWCSQTHMSRFVLLSSDLRKIMTNMKMVLVFMMLGIQASIAIASDVPLIIEDANTRSEHYLPDFSFAGYDNGESLPNIQDYRVIDVSEHGIIANDDIDDSLAIIKLMSSIKNDEIPSVIQFEAGRYIISSIIYFDRNYTVWRGMGSGENGTEFYFPRPLMYAPPTPELKELREYLVKFDKIQRDKKRNLHLPFTEWSWSGGYFWTRIEGQRVKKYLQEYDQGEPVAARAQSGKRGGFEFEVDDTTHLKVGQIIEIQWLNDKGENGPLLKELYQDQDVYIGSHHWNFPKLPLARQQVEILSIQGKKITIQAPLLHNINKDLLVHIEDWKHLTHIGFENFSMKFAFATTIAHHIEQGFNGIYLTRLYDGWVDNVLISNADSGILTEESANLSIKSVITTGKKAAHYSVQVGGVHNVLVENLIVENKVVHPMSFNTFSTKSVYLGGEIRTTPKLDQHSGANHQNLFDGVQLDIDLKGSEQQYPLFDGGGAKYWKPSHAAFNTLWNLKINFVNSGELKGPIVLDGITQGTLARLLGIHANLPITLEYGLDPYVEKTNEKIAPHSLYQYQLESRLSSSSASLNN
ncbi:hypothetical protein [Glaciecola petra]|uniref:Pectate lyase superfamily protein domain-containing protein n=1 Tax=Glaciecola petra TaxID=3075602 RepID=A0ABU2ZXY7_9ALTE|nr:hypothetical protein [Aestuariibacter sp. P117]MDT0596272.1 hypothetical protein [Aestuariibacter sp. P117]